VTEPDTIVSDHDILTPNVRPTYLASLELGVSAAELEAATGWRPELFDDPDASVTGDSTYRHMEFMHRRPNYAEFVTAAARRHTLSSLGLIGLACKTMPTVGDAIAMHHRYQMLTNRTAVYETTLTGDRVVLSEQRPAERLGSQLISEYTMFVALQLLEDATGAPPHVLLMRTRRARLSEDERAHFERVLSAPIEVGAESTTLVMDAEVLSRPIASADRELSAYFERVLERASAHLGPGERPAIVADVQQAISERLIHGTPTASDTARRLGLGHRTMQRRLAEHGHTFAELLDALRKDLAREHLADPSLSITEVAYLLGFSERASFYRACKRWFGATPAALRAAHPSGT